MENMSTKTTMANVSSEHCIINLKINMHEQGFFGHLKFDIFIAYAMFSTRVKFVP